MSVMPDTLVSRQYKKRSQFGEIWHRIKRNKGAVAGMIILIILILIMIYSVIFISYDDIMRMDPMNRFAKPGLAHPFGTDDMGRDLFIRTLYGTRYSLTVGFGAICFSLIVGVFLGAIAGYMGGLIEEIIMRASDILASIPAILMGMCIVTTLGPSLQNLMIAIGITAVPGFVRVARASVMTIKTNEYIESAHAIGMSNFRIIFAQVVPNGLSPIIVMTTGRIGIAILEASSLSFLGFGIPVPTPEWGALVSAGRNFMRTASYLTTLPGLFIVFTVLAFNIMGDGLRDALDPKLKR